MDRVNRWSLDRWKLTFDVPRLLLIEFYLLYLLFGVRWRIIGHPFGYRKTRDENIIWRNTTKATFLFLISFNVCIAHFKNLHDSCVGGRNVLIEHLIPMENRYTIFAIIPLRKKKKKIFTIMWYTIIKTITMEACFLNIFGFVFLKWTSILFVLSWYKYGKIPN